jgi:hypothetical protein
VPTGSAAGDQSRSGQPTRCSDAPAADPGETLLHLEAGDQLGAALASRSVRWFEHAAGVDAPPTERRTAHGSGLAEILAGDRHAENGGNRVPHPARLRMWLTQWTTARRQGPDIPFAGCCDRIHGPPSSRALLGMDVPVALVSKPVRRSSRGCCPCHRAQTPSRIAARSWWHGWPVRTPCRPVAARLDPQPQVSAAPVLLHRPRWLAATGCNQLRPWRRQGPPSPSAFCPEACSHATWLTSSYGAGVGPGPGQRRPSPRAGPGGAGGVVERMQHATRSGALGSAGRPPPCTPRRETSSRPGSRPPRTAPRSGGGRRSRWRRGHGAASWSSSRRSAAPSRPGQGHDPCTRRGHQGHRPCARSLEDIGEHPDVCQGEV